MVKMRLEKNINRAAAFDAEHQVRGISNWHANESNRTFSVKQNDSHRQLLRVSLCVREENVPDGKKTGAWGPSVSSPGREMTVDAEVLSSGLRYPQQNQRSTARGSGPDSLGVLFSAGGAGTPFDSHFLKHTAETFILASKEEGESISKMKWVILIKPL